MTEVSTVESDDGLELQPSLEKLRELGEQLARGESIRVHTHVLYELSDGAEGIKHPGDRVTPMVVAETILSAAGVSLAETYLRETRLDATSAEIASRLEAGVRALDPTRLTSQERREYRSARQYTGRLKQLLTSISSSPSGALAPDEIEDLQGAGVTKDIIRIAQEMHAQSKVSHQDLPGGVEADTTLRRLEANALIGDAERDEYLERLLMVKGVRQPSLGEWLNERAATCWEGRARSWLTILAGDLFALPEEEAEPSPIRVPEVRIGSRLTLVRPAIAAFREDREAFARAIRKIEQGELCVFGGTLEVLREAEMTVETGQFMRLSNPEIRAITALFRLFTARGDDGSDFLHDSLTVSFSALCEAAGVDPRQTRARRAIFGAFDTIARQEVFVPFVYKKDGKKWIYGTRAAMCEFEPIWKATTRRTSEVQNLIHQWAGRNVDGEVQPWCGELPDACTLKLPRIMCRVLGALHVSGDILRRLEKGAKQVRGGNKGFLQIDWALFLEISQTLQPRQLSSDRRGMRSYVNRESFVRRFLGESELTKRRERGHYKVKVIDPYEKAAEVMLKAGIVTEWTPNYETKGGDRDVFDRNPEVFLSDQGRANRTQAGHRRAKKFKRGKDGDA